MSNKSAEALAQAFVKQAEALVQKSILEFALRAVLRSGMAADDIADLVKDVLHKIKTEPSDNSEATDPLHNKTTGPKDTSAAKIAELEMKIQALQNEAKDKSIRKEIKPRPKLNTIGRPTKTRPRTRA
ncbi:hypothetical protein C8A00DRAFT_31145 [Chaetomidium leptoderma]|uniref:Uncharacterized protein n=1 Tax=Chaetomidium leptoderma TaxID=669021 RepID=A0AAN6VR03_9PEZI|nr:hypothetical protein C8A00DRAFT_31145 [Chaetomidium leptoderma]